MTIDPSKWTITVPNKSLNDIKEKYEVANDKWIETLPKKKKNGLFGKYKFVTFLFIIGLIFVSVIKNQTRNLQKEIDELQASIKNLRSDLHKSTLDYHVITSPENISTLANEYLEGDFNFYKKSK